MPHCIIEHSKNLDSIVSEPQFLSSLFDIIADTKLFDPQAIKLRSMAYSNIYLGSNHEDFLACNLHILAGRPEESRKALAHDIHAFLISSFNNHAVSLSVNIVEMNPATYIK